MRGDDEFNSRAWRWSDIFRRMAMEQYMAMELSIQIELARDEEMVTRMAPVWREVCQC
jgi:hypothetical protein